MAAGLTYKCFDLTTFVPLGMLPLTGVTFGASLNAAGSFSATLNIADPHVQNMDWERCTREDATALIIDYNGSPIWGGWINARDYDGQTHLLTVSAGTFEDYFAQRLQAADYTKPDPTADFWEANPADPTVIAAQILIDSQQGSLTFPAGIGPICGDGNNYTNQGVMVLVNGAPPPKITGVSAHGWTISGLNGMYLQGMNPGVRSGSVISGPNIATGAITTPQPQQISSAPTVTGCTGTWTGVTNRISLHMPAGKTPVVGAMLVGDGLPTITTIQSIIAKTATQTWTVQLGNNTTVSHSGGTSVTMTGFYSVGLPSPATATSAYTGGTYAISSGAGACPTPSVDWVVGSYPVTQFRYVIDIINELSQMGYGLGFDYGFDITYLEPFVQIPFCTLNIAYPRRGVSGSAVTLVINRGQMIGFRYTESSKGQAIGLAETASGSGGIPSQILSESELLTNNNFAPIEGAISHSRVNSPNVLAGLALGDLQQLANPLVTPTVTVPLALADYAGNIDPTQIALTDFTIGDDVILRIDPFLQGDAWGPNNDPRFPNGMNYEFRIVAWTCTIPDDGVATIVFQLDTPPLGATVTASVNLSTTPQNMYVSSLSLFSSSGGSVSVVVSNQRHVLNYTGISTSGGLHLTGVTVSSGTLTVPSESALFPYPPPTPPLN